jgi:two-component system capsular synthesis sensor histidine kinase RcsC
MLASETAVGKEPCKARASARRRQVLVVDDNGGVRDVLSRMLSFLGYDVTVAGNGLEGGTCFLMGSFDLVVTDLQMPLMNGWELARLVKERSAKTPVIVVSGALDRREKEKMNTECVDAMIPKPFRLEEIDETLQRLLSIAK